MDPLRLGRGFGVLESRYENERAFGRAAPRDSLSGASAHRRGHRCGGYAGRARLPAGPHPYAHPYAHCYAHRDAYPHAHRDAYPYAHRDAYSYAHRDAYSYAHRDAYSYAHRDAYSYAHRDAYSHAHRDAYSHAHRDAYPHAHRDAYPHAHRDVCPDRAANGGLSRSRAVYQDAFRRGGAPAGGDASIRVGGGPDQSSAVSSGRGRVGGYVRRPPHRFAVGQNCSDGQ